MQYKIIHQIVFFSCHLRTPPKSCSTYNVENIVESSWITRECFFLAFSLLDNSYLQKPPLTDECQLKIEQYQKSSYCQLERNFFSKSLKYTSSIAPELLEAFACSLARIAFLQYRNKQESYLLKKKFSWEPWAS